MDSSLIRTVKDIPHQFRRTVESMFEEASDSYHDSMAELKKSVSRLQEYIHRSEEGSPARRGRKPGATSGTNTSTPMPGTRRRRKGGRFAISEFVINELRQAGKGMRPVELAARLSQETGREKKSALGNINTLLMRLRASKAVVRRGGLYTATGSASVVATSPTTEKTGKAGGRRKSSKRFKTGPFVVAQLQAHPKGMRPTDIAKALSVEAPGAHTNALSVVNTTLARLLSQGQVKKLAPGIWAAGSVSSASSEKATKKTSKRRGRKKKATSTPF